MIHNERKRQSRTLSVERLESRNLLNAAVLSHSVTEVQALRTDGYSDPGDDSCDDHEHHAEHDRPLPQNRDVQRAGERQFHRPGPDYGSAHGHEFALQEHEH